MKVTISNRQKKVRLNRRQIERDALKALDLLGFEGAELSLLFINGERMQALNKEYRRVDRDTDVLSFPLYDSYKEFPVLLVHGLVHLMGMDHEKGGYEGKKMRLMEKRLLGGLGG
ncbi:MAG: rRNA maturation RNase YbeY [Nitrospirota bacterium]